MGNFCVASVFSDHMVLQRNERIHFFGTGDEETQISVTVSGDKTVSFGNGKVTNGKFDISINPLKEGGPFSVTLESDENKVTFRDVYIGEVWLLGGQSNMELELGTAVDGKTELKNGLTSDVRFYYTQKKSVMDSSFFEEEKKTSWQLFDDKYNMAWSAVGYFFGKMLSEKLGCKVGLIGCNWGGTSASAWMDRESLENDENLRSYVDEYDEAVKGKTEEEQIKEYNEYLEYHTAWDRECGKLYGEDPEMTWGKVQEILGPCKWPGPMNCANPFRPSGLYECMFKRVCPYTVKGVLFYQGESDDHKPYTYEKLFMKMIDVWRRDYKKPDLPFIFVQLPMHRYKDDPDFGNWPIIREAQTNVFRKIGNTGMAVIWDYSKFNEIHPPVKKPVGERLCLQALNKVYHMLSEEEVNGPFYKTYSISEDGHEMILEFDYAGKGFLVLADGNLAITGFEAAGEDREFYEADCTIDKDKLIVSSVKVDKIKYVRYGFRNYTELNLFSAGNELPVAPFRTDCEDHPEGLTLHKEGISQLMEL